MSAEPDVGKDGEGVEAERRATSCKIGRARRLLPGQKERSQRSSETVVAPVQPVTQRRLPRLAGEAKECTAVPLADKPAAMRSKPFSMSHGGMTQAEFTQYLRDHGSR
jgi:hypothetical protein